MNRIILSLFASALLLSATSVEASETCPGGEPPDACFNGLCDPYLGPPPTFADDVCCDESTGWCVEPGPRGCARGQETYYCDYGQVDAASGQVQCFFETYQILPGDPPPAADEDPLCCNDDGCTLWVAGCEGGGGWVGYCYGDMLIMDDGTVHCYQEDC